MNALELIKIEVAKFKTSSILRMISQITWGGPGKFNLNEKDAFLLKHRQFDLNLISKYAIMYSDESRGKSSDVSFNDIQKLLDILNEFLFEPQFSDEKKLYGKLSEDTINSFFRREFQLQLRFQRDFHQGLGRTLTIYNDLLKMKKRRIDYERGFDEIYGMNLERFLQICYLIFVGYMSGKERIKAVIEFCRTLPGFHKEEVSKVFKFLSITQNKFMEIMNRRKIDDPNFEYYDFNPLQTYPIYSLNEEEFIIPSYYEFNFRMVDGIYFDLFNKYGDNTNLKSNPFSEDLGETFEEYIDIQYKTANRHWKPEFIYADGKKFSDYSILEEENLILVELKTKRLRLPSRTKGLTKDFIVDLESGIIKGLVQIQEKIKDVKNQVKGLEDYFSAKNFYGIVLTLDRLYLGNSPAIRKVIENILNKKGIRLEFEFQIMEVEEFEYLIESFQKGMTWMELIRRKLESDVKENPFKTLNEITPQYSTRENKLLRDRFNNFNQTIINALPNIEFPGKYPILSMSSLNSRQRS